MIRGLYAAASGMIAQMARQDVYAHNLANAGAVGFRRARTAVGQFADDLAAAAGAAGRANGGIAPRDAGLETTTGPLTQTAQPFDLALGGDAFFTVQTPTGLAYTRDGRFRLDAQRRLVTSQGDLVMGEQGPLTISGGDFVVTERGEVHSEGQRLGNLRLAVPVAPRAAGEGRYLATRTTPAVNYSVNQGMVEQSNVNAVQEMGRMLNGFRLYEANATSLRYQDESLGTLQKIVE